MPKHSKFCTEEEWKIENDSGSFEMAMATANETQATQNFQRTFWIFLKALEFWMFLHSMNRLLGHSWMLTIALWYKFGFSYHYNVVSASFPFASYFMPDSTEHIVVVLVPAVHGNVNVNYVHSRKNQCRHWLMDRFFAIIKYVCFKILPPQR